jgi:ribosomal protein L37AE/L43A
MIKMKCCPKCGSTNINFLAFYHPSIWKCQDCGYEGAFIIEDSELTEKMQEYYQGKRGIIGMVENEFSMDDWVGCLGLG